jgi:hypothetical protein
MPINEALVYFIIMLILLHDFTMDQAGNFGNAALRVINEMII